MISSLGHYLNSVLLVAIPSIFEDAKPRSCKLTGIEAAGLWLAGAELADKVSRSGDGESASVFVPFTQIAFLLPPGEIPMTPVPGDQHTKVHAGKNHKKNERLKRLPGK